MRWRSLVDMLDLSNIDPITDNYIQSSIDRAEAFLLSGQDPDGFWRDYQLIPGESEAWVTAVVGFSLCYRPKSRLALSSLKLASRALVNSYSPIGWGYNRSTGADADTTAWVFRFLSRTIGWTTQGAQSCLLRYLDEDGFAHTFSPTTENGNWGKAHLDVTPVLGLALMEVGVDNATLMKISQAILKSFRRKKPGWKAYWWDCNSYATAHCLQFLNAINAAPDSIIKRIAESITIDEDISSSFEAAQKLLILIELKKHLNIRIRDFDCLHYLLDNQLGDGSWSSSQVLKVPPRNGKVKKLKKQKLLFSDFRKLLSTAMCCLALKKVRDQGM